MKFFQSPAVLAIIFCLAGYAPALEAKKDGKSEKIERSTVVDARATITLCVMSGKIMVRGWDKNELRVRSVDVGNLELRRIDKPRDASTAATRIDVMVFDKTDRLGTKGDCQAFGNVEMDVPTGATVQVQTRDGDIQIGGVAAAYAGSQNGDIRIERVTRLVEAGSVGGSISLKDSSGRISLSSAGGGVEAANIRAGEGDDTFEVGTVTGDIQLTQVSRRKVVAKTVNGSVNMSGPLLHGGNYGFSTMSGDVNLTLPADASFQLNAKISDNRTIVSDFPLKPMESWPTPPATPPVKTPSSSENIPKAPPDSGASKGRAAPAVAPVVVRPSVAGTHYALRRVIAVCGNGDALIQVASFGGTLRLRKM